MSTKDKLVEYIFSIKDPVKFEELMKMFRRAVAGEDIDSIAASYGMIPDGKGGYIKTRPMPWD